MKKVLFILLAAITITSCSKQEKQTDSNEPQSVSARAKKKSSALRVGGDLFNTQGLQISGSFYVGRGATHDTLIGTVTNWNGLWHDYHFNWCPPIYSTLPGGEGATNYGQWQPQIAVPFTYTTIVAHGGTTQCYFFGVSSDYGANVAGKSVTVN
jgi:hypothetical protein